MGGSTQKEDRDLRKALRDVKKRDLALESKLEERGKRINTGPMEFRDSLQEHEGDSPPDSPDIYRLHKECLDVLSAAQHITDTVGEKILDREDREEKERVPLTDDESFGITSRWIHRCVETALDVELEVLLSVLRDEEKTFKENKWSEGPYHTLLGANLNLMSISRDEWRVSFSRMDPEAKAADLTTEQKNLMRRIQEAVAGAISETKAVAERNKARAKATFSNIQSGAKAGPSGSS